MKHIGSPKLNMDQIPSIGFLHCSLLVHQTAIPCEIDVGDPEGPRQVASLSVIAAMLDDVGGRCKEASTVCMSHFF